MPVLWLMAMILMSSLAVAEPQTVTQPQSPQQPTTAQQAIKLVYGDQVYHSEQLLPYFKQDTGYVHVTFQREFMEAGVEKRLVVFSIHASESTTEENLCADCDPLIGIALLQQRGEILSIEAASPVIGWRAAQGNQFSLQVIGTDKHAILLHSEEAFNGIAFIMTNSIYLPFDGKILNALNTGFIRRPDPFICAQGTPQSATLEFEPVTGEVYYRAKSRTAFNSSDCEHQQHQVFENQYRYASGNYLEVNVKETP